MIQVNTGIGIPSGNGWITAEPATKVMRPDELKFNVVPYGGSQGEKREGKVYVNYGNGKQETFTIVQLNNHFMWVLIKIHL